MMNFSSISFSIAIFTTLIWMKKSILNSVLKRFQTNERFFKDLSMQTSKRMSRQRQLMFTTEFDVLSLQHRQDDLSRAFQRTLIRLSRISLCLARWCDLIDESQWETLWLRRWYSEQCYVFVSTIDRSNTETNLLRDLHLEQSSSVLAVLLERSEWEIVLSLLSSK